MVRAEVIAYAGVPAGFRAWPVAGTYGELVLDGGLSDEQTGLLIAGIASSAEPPRVPIMKRLRGVRSPTVEQLIDPGDVVSRLLRADCLSTQGGVRLTDETTGTVLGPGCCVQVDDWTLWTDLVRGEAVVVGHDPELVVEVHAGSCFAWSADGGDAQVRGPLPHEPRVGFPAATVPEQISTMRHGLIAATARIGEWAAALVPDQADVLVARVREAWCVG